MSATGGGVQSKLKRTAAGASTVRFGAFATVLIVAEIALSIGFLSMGAAVAESSLADRSEGRVGIDLERHLYARLQTPLVESAEELRDEQQEEYWTRVGTNQSELKRRLQAEPSIGAVAMGRTLPGMNHPRRSIEVEGGGLTGRSIAHAEVDVDFFQDLGHPVLEGRGFGSGDLPEERGAPRLAVVVNTTFVEQVLGGRQAVGRRIRHVVRDGQEPEAWLEIIGVVGRLGMSAEDPERDAGVYHPVGPDEVQPMHYVIETGGDPSAFVPRLRSLASAVDPDAMIQGPQPLDELVAARALEERLASLMILVLAGLGAILAAAGLYAIVSFTVSQRTHEIGIRRALGAHPTRILSTIARRAALQLGAGVVLGVPLGAVLINEITADAGVAAQSVPALVGSVTVGVVLVTCLACLAPTKRGLRVRPTEALREG